MDGQVPKFRRLRQLREKLERDIYNRDELVESRYITDAADRWQQTASYRTENERDQELVDEINFVLDYFRPQASPWTVRAYFILIAVSIVVMALAAVAFVRTF